MTVADNGTGMPKGITLENQASLGLRLVSRLTGQLRGTVAISSEGGAKFVFVFPKPAEIPEKDLPANTPAQKHFVPVTMDCAWSKNIEIGIPRDAAPENLTMRDV